MATTAEAIAANETLTITTVTVTEPSSTTTAAKNSLYVFRVNRKIDKNDPYRFKGEGISFNAKMIGTEPVPEARGDAMCQEKIRKLKADVKASGLHKQRIIVNVSEEGIKLVDVRHGIIEHSHPVHKVSFISRDMSDSRAFGYIFSTEDKNHHFYAIKTEKAAEAVVLTLRDLFQIIFERKKKEMEEAKKQQTEEKKEEKPNPNVIRLDGDLNTESNTDEEPLYSIPHNNQPVKERAGSSLVDLESELATIGQGIEQMNKLEVFFESEHPPTSTSTPSSDPWGLSSTSTPSTNTTPSSSADLQDLDLFGTKPASPIDKKSILGLFGNQPTMPPSNPNLLHPGFGGFGAPSQPGFGAPSQPGFGAPSQPGFGAPPQPGFGVPPQTGFGAPIQAGFGQPVAPSGFGGQPGFGAPTANPFGGQPMPGTPAPFAMGAFPPTVPQRPGFVPQTANPFGGTASPAFPPMSNDPFGEPLLAPVKMKTEEKSKDSPKLDAFGDLCEIGTKSTDKTPKQLFAEKNSGPKMKINELKTINNPPVVQASSPDPFGTIDCSLEAIDETRHDPFDTSFISNPIRAVQHASIPAYTKPNQLPAFTDDEESDSDNFDMPSPEGPPPPLPPERNSIAPAPPPRPNSSPITSSQRLLSCDNPHIPALPPRNMPPESQKTSIKPVPRPRPQSRGLGETLTESHSSPSNLGQNTRLKIEEINNSSSSNNDSIDSSHSSSSHFMIEDPFKHSDPFADCDPFNGSDGFSGVFDSNGNDPFTVSFTSQSKGQIDSTDDPFSVFDKAFREPFKTNGIQKSIKPKPPPANDPFDTFFK